MNLALERRWRGAKSTVSPLFVDGVLECYCLEDKVRELDGIDASIWKVDKETAIPAGRYRVIKDYSNRFKRVTLHVISVPSFLGIRFHPGNTPEDTEGCFLTGRKHTNGDSVQESKLACDALEAKLFPILDTPEQVWITVINPPGDTPEQMLWASR